MALLNVTSEVGRLRRVLVHEPGGEVDQMVPSMMEELLFDDILFGEAARHEHRQFTELLQLLDVEVLEVTKLLEETLAVAEAREWILGPLLNVTPAPIAERIRSLGAAEAAVQLIEGVRMDPAYPSIVSDELFEIPPLPNLCFQRDPQIVIHDHVIISSMAATARWREAFLSSAIFRFHPSLKQAPILLDHLDPQGTHQIHPGSRKPHFEGGDFLVLSKDVVALGFSERTNRFGVQHIARALSQLEEGPRWLVVIALPNERAFMHLDTVLTPVDHDACLVHAPIFAGNAAKIAQVFRIDLHSKDLTPSAQPNLLDTLKTHGIDLKPILCGGSDPILQRREQWTDGANALALAPGIITLYDRNRVTADELANEGFRIVEVKPFSDDLRAERESFSLETASRTCILLPSHEMSRARGGPHCLSHPIHRDD